MLLTNLDLMKKYGKIPSLIPFLKTILTDEIPENKEQNITKMCKEYLQKAEELLNRETAQDADMSLLTQLTREICDCYEFKTGRKDLYVQLSDYFLSYEMGELNKKEYLTQLLQMLFENNKLHLSKESRQIILCYGKSLADSSGNRHRHLHYREKTLQKHSGNIQKYETQLWIWSGSVYWCG